MNNGSTLPTGRDHLAALSSALASLEHEVDRVDAWGRHLASVLMGGGRLLAVGNGGSAAQAQHQRLQRRRGLRPAGSSPRPPGGRARGP